MTAPLNRDIACWPWLHSALGVEWSTRDFFSKQRWWTRSNKYSILAEVHFLQLVNCLIPWSCQECSKQSDVLGFPHCVSLIKSLADKSNCESRGHFAAATSVLLLVEYSGRKIQIRFSSLVKKIILAFWLVIWFFHQWKNSYQVSDWLTMQHVRIILSTYILNTYQSWKGCHIQIYG